MVDASDLRPHDLSTKNYTTACESVRKALRQNDEGTTQALLVHCLDGALVSWWFELFKPPQYLPHSRTVSNIAKTFQWARAPGRYGSG
jgi:hypothetical protein